MEEMNFEALKDLGKFTNELRQKAMKIPKPGINILEIIEFIEESIFEKGYLPAFPCTVCINEEAAHSTIFDEEIILKKGDVIKVDFGVSDKGIITDNAFTLEIETNFYEKLLTANKEALDAALEVAKIGCEISKIGSVVHKTAKKYGFETIHNLSGHQVELNNLHAGLHIPNYDNNSKRKIEEGFELAIEPFLTTGDPLVKDGKLGNILHLKSSKNVRDAIARKVLNHIKEKYPKLPFSKRWLLKEFDKKKVVYAINVLKRENIIYEYNVLVSNNGAIISQFEDTIVFEKDKKTIITRL